MTREEAIERIKYRIGKQAWALDENDTEALYEIIPELAESEDKDEKIRKGIVETIKQCPDTFLNPKNRDEMIAYLEKHKRQKPRKFKLGDKVHWHNDDTNVITITGFRDDAYLTDSAHGPILFCDEVNWERIEQKPCQTCDEYDKGYKQGYAEGCTAGYNKAMLEQEPAEWSEEEAKKAAEDYADEFPGMTHENDGSTIEDYDKPYNDFMAGVLWAKNQGIFQNGNTHKKSSEEKKKETLDGADIGYGLETAIDILENGFTHYQTDDGEYERKQALDVLIFLLNETRKKEDAKLWSKEDEERLINTSISFLKDFADKGYENAVECINWLKSKLNGNSGK